LRKGTVDATTHRAQLQAAVTTSKVDYCAWWSYSFQRLGGLELGSFDLMRDRARPKASTARLDEQVALASFGERRDWQRFDEAYADPSAGVAPRGADNTRPALFPTCTGPLTYTGQAAIAADIAPFKSALKANGLAAAS
jgi:5-methyltetrahydropteroyltriglutamate--homocysteine methyltransferase